MSETSGELGGALGIAILGSIGTAVYRTEVAESLPAGVPAAAADAARDTLGGALAIAQTLPDAVGTALVEVAQYRVPRRAPLRRRRRRRRRDPDGDRRRDRAPERRRPVRAGSG